MTSAHQISFQCLRIKQPIGEFYIGAVNSQDLISIAWADIRRIASPSQDLPPINDPEEELKPLDPALESTDLIESLDEEIVPLEDQGFERFLGIQRELSLTRVKEIQQYVTTVDAAFPTSILLSVSSNHAHYDESVGKMTIVRHSKAAKIIDGQHRIAGLRNYTGEPFQLNVAVFIDMDIQDQAMVFATINLKQTKVNKSLAYDLYEFTTSRSPQKTCHDIARFLNSREGSPFEQRIKMLGVATGAGETLTQATFVDRLLRLISRDPMDDRDKIRRRKPLDKATGKISERQIFRNLFIDKQDAAIAKIVWNYFLAVRRRWPQAWSDVQRGNVLNRTTGFAALMRFLRISYLKLADPGEIVATESFSEIFDSILLPDMSFSPETYLPGSSGEKALFDALVSKSGLAAL